MPPKIPTFKRILLKYYNPETTLMQILVDHQFFIKFIVFRKNIGSTTLTIRDFYKSEDL